MLKCRRWAGSTRSGSARREELTTPTEWKAMMSSVPAERPTPGSLLEEIQREVDAAEPVPVPIPEPLETE